MRSHGRAAGARERAFSHAKWSRGRTSLHTDVYAPIACVASVSGRVGRVSWDETREDKGEILSHNNSITRQANAPIGADKGWALKRALPSKKV